MLFRKIKDIQIEGISVDAGNIAYFKKIL